MIFPSRSFASAFFASAAPPVEESDPPRAARDDFAASPFAATPPPRPPLARPNHPLFLESSSTLAVRVATSSVSFSFSAACSSFSCRSRTDSATVLSWKVSGLGVGERGSQERERRKPTGRGDRSTIDWIAREARARARARDAQRRHRDVRDAALRLEEPPPERHLEFRLCGHRPRVSPCAATARPRLRVSTERSPVALSDCDELNAAR